MGELNKLIDLVEKVTKSQSKRMDELELKIGRSNLIPPVLEPGQRGYQTRSQNTSMVLEDQDKSFLKFVRHGIGALAPDEQKALVEDATGQYLVSPVITQEIDRAVAELVVMRKLCAQKTIDKDRLQVRGIDEATVSWGKLEAGAGIVESNLTPTAPTYKYVEDLYGLSKVGEDELADSDVNLANILIDSFSRAIADAEETAFVAGTGHDNQQPDGFTVDPTLVAATVTGAAAGAVAIEEFLEMVYTCPSKFRSGASFLANSLTALELRKLRWKDAAGTYEGGFLWQPSQIAGQPATFLGYPIYTQDNMATLAGTEGVIAAFGNFKMGYRILDHTSGLTVQRLVELYAEAGGRNAEELSHSPLRN